MLLLKHVQMKRNRQPLLRHEQKYLGFLRHFAVTKNIISYGMREICVFSSIINILSKYSPKDNMFVDSKSVCSNMIICLTIVLTKYILFPSCALYIAYRKKQINKM